MKPLRLAILTISLLVVSGCASRQQVKTPCCLPIHFHQPAKAPAISVKPAELGVSVDWTEPETNSRVSPTSHPSEPVRISLEECVCIAAANSQLANLVDQERVAISKQDSDICPHDLDVALSAQSLEQRNKSAALAARLFLNLVEVEMQRTMLIESEERLDEFRETVETSREQGLATAAANNEYEKQMLRLDKLSDELELSNQRLQFQLANLLHLPTTTNLKPVFLLAPHLDNLVLSDEINTAYHHRPMLMAQEHFLTSGDAGSTAIELLSQFDRRLGFSLPARVVRKKLLRIRQPAKTSDKSTPIRKQQLADAYEAAKTAVRAEVGTAVFDLQSANLNLKSATIEIARLEGLTIQIEQKRQLDSKSSYLESQQNWMSLQEAKSNRISAAIELRSAQLSLLAAQGRLIEDCGYQLITDCACDCQ